MFVHVADYFVRLNSWEWNYIFKKTIWYMLTHFSPEMYPLQTMYNVYYSVSSIYKN